MAFTQVIKTLGSVMASMKTAVDTWLSQNITNPSNPPLDRSLSLANACAPADLVGDLRNELSESNSVLKADDLIFTIGGMAANGCQYTRPTLKNRINSAKFPVYALGGTISCTSNYKFRVAYYTSDTVPYDMAPPTNFVKYGDWVSGDSYNIESGYYIVILAGFSNDNDITNKDDVSKNLNINIIGATKYLVFKDNIQIISNSKAWSNGLYSAGSGAYEATNYRIKYDGYLPEYIDAIFTDTPYTIRLCAYENNTFVGVLKTNGNFEKNTTIMAEKSYYNMAEFRKTYPSYMFKIYALSDTSSTGALIDPTEAVHIYFIENLLLKSLDDNAKFAGKTIAIIGDSISTNGNDGIDSNVPEITIQPEDVGIQLSAYLTYYDVQNNLTIAGHTYTSDEIGTEVIFTPTLADVGKSIGLPNNYNANVVTTWWEVMQSILGVRCIPNTWSGASITSHEDSNTTRKCSYAWHESQIRKCGIRTPGTMTRTEPDMIIIYRGTNDMTHSPYTVLTEDYFDSAEWDYPSTDLVNGSYGYKQGLCLTIKKLRESYPNAKIFICTLNVFKRINYSHFPTNNGLNTLPQYNNAIREVANYMGCGVIEFDKDGITFENCYSQGYITDSATIPTHPNDKGHRVMGLKAIADLKAQYSDMV